MFVRQISTADAEDFDRFLQNVENVRQESPSTTAFLASPGCLAYGAFVEESIVGSAWGYHLPRPDGPPMLLLYSLHVDEAHRRRGIGTALVEAFRAHAERDGCRKLWLTTEASNQPAQRLYDGAGGRARPASVFYEWDLRTAADLARAFAAVTEEDFAEAASSDPDLADE